MAVVGRSPPLEKSDVMGNCGRTVVVLRGFEEVEREKTCTQMVFSASEHLDQNTMGVPWGGRPEPRLL